MSYTATYSPEDNKLRLYSSTRLDAETYARIKAAGFSYAPKQELFFAPMWTPQREDLLLELCGEIGDEDTSLVERAEKRSDRFSEYSDKRADDADRAHKAVTDITDGIPFGQPILVGHHSERRARKDAERIESGMRRALKMWDTSKYWTARAAGAVRHAKYKEAPAVRARRIKTLEADQRKQDRYKQEAEMWLKLWTDCANEKDKDLQAKVAVRIAGMCHLHLPRKAGDREDFDGKPSAYDALTGSFTNLYAPRTLNEVLDAALSTYPRSIPHYDRWINHLEHRIAYEKAMLAESGGTVTDKTGPQKGGACRCWASYRGGWSYIQKVNKVSVSILRNYSDGGRPFSQTIPFDKLTGVMTAAEVQAKRNDGLLIESADGIGFSLRQPPPPEEATEIDPEAGLRRSWDEEGVPKERQDELIADVTAKAQPGAKVGPFTLGSEIAAMRQTLKTGVQVVAAPQLFPTPPALAARMVELAGIEETHRVLEPSAGTGNILRLIGNGPDKVAVEINGQLVRSLLTLGLSGLHVHHGDFLDCDDELGKFERIVMNPPFADG